MISAPEALGGPSIALFNSPLPKENGDGVISIKFSKSSYWPGEEVNADIILSLQKPVKARGLYATLECVEKKHVRLMRQFDQYDYDRQKELGLTQSTNIKVTHQEEESKIFHKEFQIGGERKYYKETFPMSFSLPKDAAPTSYEFGHDDKIHVWKLKIRLDVPMALDKNAEAEIFVEGLGK